jgi:hypothetical protein
MSRNRFTKRQRIAPASFFFEPDVPVRRKKNRAACPENVARAEPVAVVRPEVVQPPVEPPEPPVESAPLLETPPPVPLPVQVELPATELPQEARITGSGEVRCEWCGQSVEMPAHGEYLRPFVINKTAHFHSPCRGRRRKPAPELPQPQRLSTWSEVERRSERFWNEYYARRMAEAA